MAAISILKEELLAMLETAKAKAEKEDAKITAKHAKDEEAAMRKFHDRLRVASNASYATAKKEYSGYSAGVKLEPPTCPKLNATPIIIAIRQVKADSRKNERLNIGDEHDWYKAAFWLPPSEQPKKSVCEDAE